MLALLLELFRSAESLPELAAGGAWFACMNCLISRQVVAREAVESGIFDLGVAHVRSQGATDRGFRGLT